MPDCTPIEPPWCHSCGAFPGSWRRDYPVCDACVERRERDRRAHEDAKARHQVWVEKLQTQAIEQIARDVLSIELAMEHRDSAREVTSLELRRLLEAAYDAGRKSALS